MLMGSYPCYSGTVGRRYLGRYHTLAARKAKVIPAPAAAAAVDPLVETFRKQISSCGLGRVGLILGVVFLFRPAFVCPP